MAITWDKLLNIDRRIIFLVIALAIIIPPLIPGFKPPVRVTNPVRKLYNVIEELPAGSVVLVSQDYDPSSAPELTPMAIAVMKHCFKKKLKVIGMTMWLTGMDLARINMKKAAAKSEYTDKSGKKYEVEAKEYTDWVDLGWKSGANLVIMIMANQITNIYPKDRSGKRLSEIDMMKNVKKLKDVGLIVSLSAGSPGIDTWVQYAGEFAPGVPIGGGCTGVSATGVMPFLDSGQLVGLMPAMKAAAEYEKLVEQPGLGSKGMAAQTVAHLVIILFVVIGNLAYFMGIRAKKKGGE
jgi:hypothetical protein